MDLRKIERGVRAIIEGIGENPERQGLKGTPARVARMFAEIFDGFSIGSNDLTQLTLGLDRDSELVSHLYDERNPAIKSLVASVIKTAKAKGKKVGICGQAPSDFPEIAEFLVEQGIDSMSLNPDTVIATTLRVAEKEKEMAARK